MTKLSSPARKAAWARRSSRARKNFATWKSSRQIDQGDDLAAVIAKSDVVIDFSSHDGDGRAVAELCAKHKKALVIGTTGHPKTRHV